MQAGLCFDGQLGRSGGKRWTLLALAGAPLTAYPVENSWKSGQLYYTRSKGGCADSDGYEPPRPTSPILRDSEGRE